MSHSTLVDLVLPLGVGGQGIGGNQHVARAANLVVALGSGEALALVVRAVFINGRNKFFGREHVHAVAIGPHRGYGTQFHLQWGVLQAFFSRDQNYPVGCARTINGRGRRVLEHREALDVVGIYKT